MNHSKKPLLSIIIPAYNAEKYLKECIDSIITQKDNNYELIIIDDGSTDNTPKICQQYSHDFSHIHYYRTQNQGVSNARNLGIKKANGSHIWFIDSDDLITPDAISTISERIKNTDLLVFGIEEFDKKHSFIHQFNNETVDNVKIKEYLLSDTYIRGYPVNKIFKTNIIKKNHLLFNETIKTCEDLLFCIEYSNHISNATIISQTLYKYRKRYGSALHSNLNTDQASALIAFHKITSLCTDSTNAKIKSEALFIKAFYKYKPILKKSVIDKFKKNIKQYIKDYKYFSVKDKLLIKSYRFLNPLMRFLHYAQNNSRNLYDKPKPSFWNTANAVLPFIIFFSFFIGTLNIGIISPLIIAGALTFIANIHNKNKFKRSYLTKVEISYFCFIVICIILSFFSYNKIESLKQIAKIFLLIFVFWQFIVYFRNIDKKYITKSFSVASLVFFAITFIMYLAGIIILNFNFNIDNVDVLGVTIDRHMPRLISLAYADPNITALFIAVPFAFFISQNKTKVDHFGIISASVLMSLTISRGAFVSIIPMLAYYLFLGKDHIGKRILTTIKIAVCFGITLGTLIGATSVTPANATLPHNTKNQLYSVYTNQPSTIGAIKNANVNPVEKHFDFQSGSGSGRLPLWKRGLDIIREHPISGIGLNNTFTYTKEKYGSGKYTHNTYIEIFMEEGILGGIFYVVVLLFISVACWNIRKISIFPTLLFIFIFCAQTFLSISYSEVFFAGILVIILYSKKVRKNIVERRVNREK